MNDIKRLLIIIAKQNKVTPEDGYFLLQIERELKLQEKHKEELDNNLDNILTSMEGLK